MAKIPEVLAYLNDRCTTGVASGCADGTGLTAIHKYIFNHKKNLPKAEMAKALSIFYANEKNIIDIWDSLSECERDFINYIVQYEGNEYLITTIEYAKKHKFGLEYDTTWGYKKSLMYDYMYSHLKFLHLLKRNIPNTKCVIFFPSGKDMPSFVLEALKKVVEPLKFEYREYIQSKNDYIICREGRIGDFGAIARVVASERLKAKPGTFDISKAKLAKLSEIIGFEDVCDKDGKVCAPKEAKRNNDFKVAQPLFVLAANSGLLDIDSEGYVSPGKKSSELLSLTSRELAKKLFDDYCAENKIYELHYITYITVYDGDWWIRWHECRKPIIDLLKNCPVEKFVKFEDLDKYARIFCGNFFRRLVNCAVIVKGYNFGYDHYGGYAPDWDECESQIIRLILSFLSAMGMVDIAYTENIPRIKYSDDDYCVGIAGFRITKLGAWILGITDKYEAIEPERTINNEGSLVVLPDYSVIISGLKCRVEHETYFSKFLTKTSVDENAAIYRIDFQSVIRAYDSNITPQKIKASLKKASGKPLPDNVERFLDDCHMKVGRVKIHTLTLIETDDILLLEEIKHIKGIGDIITGDLYHAVAIDKSGQKRAKALIEKNGWLVKI